MPSPRMGTGKVARGCSCMIRHALSTEHLKLFVKGWMWKSPRRQHPGAILQRPADLISLRKSLRNHKNKRVAAAARGTFLHLQRGRWVHNTAVRLCAGPRLPRTSRPPRSTVPTPWPTGSAPAQREKERESRAAGPAAL